MSIEKKFDIPFISDLALREKQIQQNYRPIIAVHKWFARRPGTLFRGLILSEFSDKPLREAFYSSNDLKGIAIADPFMGGGTPLIEANRVGCDVTGYDINPMAYWIVSREIEHLDLRKYRKSAEDLTRSLEKQIGAFYRTQCLECGTPEAHVKYFLWVKKQTCSHCGHEIDLFPGYLLAENKRHTENVIICAVCGDLNGVEDRKHPGICRSCGGRLSTEGPAKRNKCACPRCGKVNAYPDPAAGPPRHRMFAIEYHCRRCKPTHQGRFFKRPDKNDLLHYDKASSLLEQIGTPHVPDDKILPGDETDRLFRWGYKTYREMFNSRQLLGLELSCRAIAEEGDERIRNALITNLSDLLRYQNMLCRYDAMALKSLDIFSVHGFPVGLIQCESNLLGIANGGGTSVGSGGWSNILEKYVKAKTYCDHPFETRHEGGRKILAPIANEWIGDRRNGDLITAPRGVHLLCGSATNADLPGNSLDGVFTDPPYFGNVQYAELMDFCYVWVRKLVSPENPIFQLRSTRNPDELTGNVTMDRGLDHFTHGLSAVFQNMAKALKPGRPLAFTYHHNRLEAYHPVIAAILDAGLACSASIPCPAEMGASIHISGTGSSIVDTVFVCRSTGTIPRKWLAESPAQIAALVLDDLQKLKVGGLKPTRGDIRCIIYGHLARLAIWRLRATWIRTRPASEKLAVVAAELGQGHPLECIEDHLKETYLNAPPLQQYDYVQENRTSYGGVDDEISF
ncbi:MAG: DNA methylase [Proteobacteria bacterium]|nr:DNA methylase [Pseudomonadota bacterium]MBU2226175.1 DNA methylase [Pseudomonadota bacterium]MBU2261077.1 DNA methylase [Pseudomonadota bacterium]